MADQSSRKPPRDERWRTAMAAAQRGDRAAYEKLLGELLPFVRRLVRERIGERPATEDIVQDVLLKVHTARHTYRSERPLTPWLRAVTNNAVIDWGRRETRLRRRSSDADVEKAPAVAGDPEQALQAGLSTPLRRALESLPEAQRQAVLLLKVEGLSVVEAAERVGVSAGAIKLRAHRGYRALRTLLGREKW